MKVKCLGNRGSSLPEELLDPRSNWDTNTRFALTVGKTYIVYGITVYRRYLWYYICDDDFTYFPVWNPSPLFEIADHRVSKYWEVNYSPEGRDESDVGIIVAYPEWAQNPYYYGRLADNRDEEVAVFRKYQKMIDEEYG